MFCIVVMEKFGCTEIVSNIPGRSIVSMLKSSWPNVLQPRMKTIPTFTFTTYSSCKSRDYFHTRLQYII